LHALDYDKESLMGSVDNLTFDGSSIRGFSKLEKSDLRLQLDWSSFRWLPAGIFGAGKVLMFATVHDQDGSPYPGDFRAMLRQELEELKTNKGITVNTAPEIEGFLFKGRNAEERFDDAEGFERASETGYFNSRPGSLLRTFVDTLARATRAMGYRNEKDHGEVAPSQFELNYRHIDALHAADQIQLYKLTARTIADKMGLTASFLPKPIAGINGSGMHTNISLEKEGLNLFWNADDPEVLSETGRGFVAGVLTHAKSICLALNPSVNAYRRLDPAFEAPNAIKSHASDRSAMARVPLGNEKSRRVEVRTVAPDANPYLTLRLIVRAGLKALFTSEEKKAAYHDVFEKPVETLPGSLHEALEHFRKSAFIREVLGAENMEKYAEIKQAVADRSPRDLGKRVKRREIVDHHEITNQVLWNDF
jgi:glutamine synthetase